MNLLVGIILWLGWTFCLLSTSLVLLHSSPFLYFRRIQCWLMWEGLSHQQSVSTVVYLDNGITQIIIPTTLLNSFAFFSTYLDACPTFSNLGCVNTLKWELILTPLKDNIICLLIWIWTSSVQLSISYSNYLNKGIITDLNSIVKITCQLRVVLISPLAPCIQLLMPSYASFLLPARLAEKIPF